GLQSLLSARVSRRPISDRLVARLQPNRSYSLVGRLGTTHSEHHRYSSNCKPFAMLVHSGNPLCRTSLASRIFRQSPVKPRRKLALIRCSPHVRLRALNGSHLCLRFGLSRFSPTRLRRSSPFGCRLGLHLVEHPKITASSRRCGGRRKPLYSCSPVATNQSR